MAIGSYLILYIAIEKFKIEENFRKDVRAKTIKSLKVSKEEIERLKLHW